MIFKLPKRQAGENPVIYVNVKKKASETCNSCIRGFWGCDKSWLQAFAVFQYSVYTFGRRAEVYIGQRLFCL